MLKQRIITAVILLLVLLFALMAENPLYWRLLISAAVVIGFWEWLRFCKIENIVAKLLGYGLFAGSFYLLQAEYLELSLLLPLFCGLWLVLLIFTMTDLLEFLHNSWVKLILGVLVLTSAGWLIITFKEIDNGALWILCFMGAVWAADIGAYFIGRRFGKTKLAPRVSPGKSVEGLFGGLALVLLIYIPLLFSIFSTKDASLLVLTIVVTSLVSVGGDLFESKLKRYVGLKDSSQILPGHGGVLDRLDSMLAAAPFFALGIFWLGYLS